MAFVRKVKTASGATAVQIVEKRHGRRRSVEHIGSAHDEAELAVLVSVAHQRLQCSPGGAARTGPVASRAWCVPGPVVEHSASVLLWQVLQNAYNHVGFGVVDDAVFAQLVAARLIEPTSKLDTRRVLGEVGVTAPHSNTLYACLSLCVARDDRSHRLRPPAGPMPRLTAR